MEAVSFPDTEGVLVSYLNAEFAARSDAAKAGVKVPKSRGRFVRVQRVGGSRSLAYDAPLVLFECWDESGADAYSLADLARALVGALDDEVRFRSEVGGVSFFPDPLTDLPRYQFTVEFTVHGEAI